MPNKPRGNQYQPFSALKGYNEKLREKEKVKCDKKELSEEKIFELNEILKRLKKGDYLKVTYYNNFSYEEKKGCLINIDYIYKYLQIDDLKIPFNNLYDINCVFN